MRIIEFDTNPKNVYDISTLRLSMRYFYNYLNIKFENNIIDTSRRIHFNSFTR